MLRNIIGLPENSIYTKKQILKKLILTWLIFIISLIAIIPIESAFGSALVLIDIGICTFYVGYLTQKLPLSTKNKLLYKFLFFIANIAAGCGIFILIVYIYLVSGVLSLHLF